MQIEVVCKEVLKEEELLSKQKDLQQQLFQASAIITNVTERLQIAIKKDSLNLQVG